MDIKPLNADFAVSPQIMAADIPAVAAQGFKAIICNRPDGEEAEQTTADQIREAAARAGLRFVDVPAVSGATTNANMVGPHAIERVY